MTTTVKIRNLGPKTVMVIAVHPIDGPKEGAPASIVVPGGESAELFVYDTQSLLVSEDVLPSP